MATQDAAGCPLTVALDLRQGQAGAVWSALAVLDDSAAALGGDERAHRRRWQAWLYWTNLLQFLNDGEGDGIQLAASGLAGFDPLELAVTGGAGWLTTQRRIHEPTGGTTAAAATAPRDEAWNEVIEYLVEDPGLPALAAALADRGTPAPQAGYELGDAAWPAELAWPHHRIGVVLAHRTGADGAVDQDAADRDEAYWHAGWMVRTATEWDVQELGDVLSAPPAHDPNHDEEHDR